MISDIRELHTFAVVRREPDREWPETYWHLTLSCGHSYINGPPGPTRLYCKRCRNEAEERYEEWHRQHPRSPLSFAQFVHGNAARTLARLPVLNDPAISEAVAAVEEYWSSD